VRLHDDLDETTLVTEMTNRVHLVLFGMYNRTFGPHLTVMHRTLISAMDSYARRLHELLLVIPWYPYTSVNDTTVEPL
jgi:aromatic ring-cleaving dioxygenase